MALASPSQHPLATLCRLGYAAAPRAALLAGGLTAHSNPPCRVSRPSPRQAERRGTPALSAHGGHLSPCVTCDRMAAIHTLAKEAGKGLLRRRQPTESLTEACLVEGLLHPSHAAPSGSSRSAAAATTKCACACICVRVTCRPPSASCVFVRFALTSVDGTHRSPSHLRLTYCCPSWTTLHRFTCTSTIWNVAASILMDIVLPVGSR